MKSIKVFFLLLLLSTFAPYAWAATVNLTPVSYVVTVMKMELYNDDTDEWITLKDGATEFDVASVQTGQMVGEFVSNLQNFPSGTYTAFRCLISRDIQIKAYNGTHYTTAVQDDFPGATAGKAIVIAAGADPEGSAQTGTMHSPNEADAGAPAGMVYTMLDADTFRQEWTSAVFPPFTYTPGTAKRFQLDFDVTNKVTFDDVANICYTAAPDITMVME